MFSITNLNFQDGVFTPSNINGAEVMIFNSAENKEKVLKIFCAKYHTGMDPEEVLNEIFKEFNLYESDFTDPDLADLKREVIEIFESKGGIIF